MTLTNLKRLVPVTLLCLVSQLAVAQSSDDTASTAGGCAACGGVLFIIVAGIALNIALLVWVARDAKARGMDSSVLWMLLVFFTGLIGLIIYLLARPQGILVPCQNCGNKKLQAAMRCPQCGFGY
jgi:Zn finger protein HypA/HybF involved in hydrogenase expression